MQQEIFPNFTSVNICLEDLLHRRASDGKLFYKTREVAQLLHLSGYQIYYAIVRYRLDALQVCGVYRIPWFSIIDWIRDHKRIEHQFWAFQAYVEQPAKNILVSTELSELEEDPQDFYHLQDLEIPDPVNAMDLSRILRVPFESFSVQYGLEIADNLSWPDCYDLLIECEVVNLQIFADRKPTPIKERSEDLQLNLF